MPSVKTVTSLHQHAGRRDAGERTVFKSVGSALEDLAAAMLVMSAEPGAR